MYTSSSSSQAESAQRKIPRYVLYGETQEGNEGWFLNIEHLATRCQQRGWRIEPHSHPKFAQLLFVNSGSGTVTIEGVDIQFASPCVIIIPMHCVHGFDYQMYTDGQVITVAEFYLNQITERLPEFKKLWAKPSVIQLQRGSIELDELQAHMTKLERELEARSIGHFIAIESLMMTFFLNLIRFSAIEDVENNKQNTNQLRVVETFHQLIEEHYRQSWKLGDFAAALNISISQLRAACESVEGLSPIKILHQRKLTEANRNLMFSDLTIEQIAYWLGFSSPAYFTRFYKKESGVSPSDFRMNHRDINTKSAKDSSEMTPVKDASCLRYAVEMTQTS